MSDDITVGDVLAAGQVSRSTQRHPITRTGQRTPIPTYVRSAVWYRDRGMCAHCLRDMEAPLHLDHLIPWSAGGPDTTDNLRLLCEFHNQDRSNFIDDERPRRPATWWCHRCWENKTWERTHDNVICPVHGYPVNPERSRCRVQRAAWRFERAGRDFDWFVDLAPHDRFDQIAYCAHCDAPGYTGRPL